MPTPENAEWWVYSPDSRAPLDSRLEVEFIVLGFVPEEIPTAIDIQGSREPFPLTEPEFLSLISARRHTEQRLASYVETREYQKMLPRARRSYLIDTYAKSDTDAIRNLYREPAFRSRMDDFRRERGRAKERTVSP